MLKKNILFFLFLIIFLFLAYGLFYSYGFDYLNSMFLLIGTFVLSYLFFNKYFLKNKKIEIPVFFNEKKIINIIDVSLIFVFLFQILHYIYIGNIPIVKAILTSDYYYIAKIRQDIKLVTNVFINYGASFIIKALLPVLILTLFFIDKKRFWIYSIISIFYCLALMQKAYIVTLFIPLILKFLYLKKWKEFILISTIVFSGIVFLVLVTNPSLRPFSWGEQTLMTEKGERSNKVKYKSESADYIEFKKSLEKKNVVIEEEEIKDSTSNPVSEVFGAIYDRVFITTGKMVGNWFFYVPDSLPYLHGNGYRFATPFIGGKYHDYSREIYDKIYLKEASMGFTGTATTAFFMYDYANFGNFGLVLSGVYISLFLILLKRLFKDDNENMFALNGLSIIWLTSAAFSTTFFSGGWILTLILYVLLKPVLTVNKLNLDAEKNH